MMSLASNLRRLLAVALVVTALSSAHAASHKNVILAFSSLGITGSFILQLEPETGAIIDITSVSVTIDGHQYKKKEIGFFYDPAGNVNYIGGVASGIDQVFAGTKNDFLIAWKPKEQLGAFAYSNSKTPTTVSGTAVLLVQRTRLDRCEQRSR